MSDVLGFDVIAEARGVPGWGTTGDILFISAGGYHHHLGFNAWKSKGGPPQPDGVAGLHHARSPTPRGAHWPTQWPSDEHGQIIAQFGEELDLEELLTELS